MKNVGYLTIANALYLEIAGLLLYGLSKTSLLPRKLVTINCESERRVENESYEQSLIENDSNKHCGLAKLTALIKSPFDYTVFLDADTTPNINVDDLAELCCKRNWEFPLLPRHPNDQHDCTRYQGDNVYRPSMLKAFDCKLKTMPYGQSCVMLVSPRAKRWLADNHDFFLSGIERLGGTEALPGFEEWPLNVLLWTHGAKQQLNYCCPAARHLETYFDGRDYMMGLAHPETPVTWQVLHGQKNPAKALEAVERLIGQDREFFESHTYRRQKPFVLDYA